MTNELNLPYTITTHREEAMLSGAYFGEQLVLPTLLTNSIRYALGRRQARPVTFYYYGIPDDEMRERFGIEESEGIVKLSAISTSTRSC